MSRFYLTGLGRREMSITAAEVLPRRIGVEGYLAIVAVGYAAAGAILSWKSYNVLLAQYWSTQLYLLPIILFFGLGITPVIANPSRPVAWLVNIIKQRALGGLLTIAVFCFAIASFSTFKHQIPEWLPFFADKLLADADELVHFGQPWRYVHQLTPDWVGYLLGYLYGPGWFMQWLGLFVVVAFLTDRKTRVRYLLSFAAILLLLGTLVRAAMASAGPIFYDRLFAGDRFAGLMQRLSDTPSAKITMKAADYLYSSYLDNTAVFGSGIAAMPSIHVAMAVLNALFLSSIDRWLGVVGWAFAAAIMWGSIYFGWHYALDGYVSIVCVVLIWRWATIMTEGSLLLDR
jgi:membrane-associated phospholipid phosphatase